MLKIEKTVLPSPEQWEIIIEGMRNPMNSWDKMDSYLEYQAADDGLEVWPVVDIGRNDHRLMMNLAKGGAVHAKYRRMIPVYVTIDAPFYWWKEFDTYKIGTVANSCSTMHKIHSKELTLDDFSFEDCDEWVRENVCKTIINVINSNIRRFNAVNNKDAWRQVIQLLPSSFNQKRTVMLNYEVLVGMYRDRKNHKLTEWHTFCDWIESLPYSELITGGDSND